MDNTAAEPEPGLAEPEPIAEVRTGTHLCMRCNTWRFKEDMVEVAIEWAEEDSEVCLNCMDKFLTVLMEAERHPVTRCEECRHVSIQLMRGLCAVCIEGVVPATAVVAGDHGDQQ